METTVSGADEKHAEEDSASSRRKGVAGEREAVRQGASGGELWAQARWWAVGGAAPKMGGSSGVINILIMLRPQPLPPSHSPNVATRPRIPEMKTGIFFLLEKRIHPKLKIFDS